METRRRLCNKIIYLLTIMIINIKKSDSYPMFEPRDIELWQEKALDPIWLPPTAPLQDEENLQNIYGFSIIQPQKQTNFIEKPQEEEFFIEGTEMKSSPVIRQIGRNRLVKKDSFATRNWGAGGLPFSVLYMNPHGSRTNYQSTDPTKQVDSKRPMSGVDPSSSSKNTRLTTRNGINVQQRRQYSLIPQLFISYGRNSLGK